MNLTVDEQGARHLIAGLQFLKLRRMLRPHTPAIRLEMNLIELYIQQNAGRVTIMTDSELDSLINMISRRFTTSDEHGWHLIAGVRFFKMRDGLRPVDNQTAMKVAQIKNDATLNYSSSLMSNHEIDGLIKRIEALLPHPPPVP